MSPLDNEGGESTKTAVYTVKLQKCAKRYSLFQKGAYALKAVEKTSRLHGKVKSW